MIRFDQFLEQEHIALLPIEQLAGFALGVILPPEWETLDEINGASVWIGPTHPRGEEFCPNAVLTLHRVQAALDSAKVFSMLCEQQRQSVPNCHELHRLIAPAKEGPGSAGNLALRIDHELGLIDSVTWSRIVPDGNETLIAQLTLTALRDSAIDKTAIKLDFSLRDSSEGDHGPAASGAPVGR